MRELETWLTVSQAAREIGISRQGLYVHLEEGALRAIRTRAGWIVEPEAVERFAREYAARRRRREAAHGS